MLASRPPPPRKTFHNVHDDGYVRSPDRRPPRKRARRDDRRHDRRRQSSDRFEENRRGDRSYSSKYSNKRNPVSRADSKRPTRTRGEKTMRALVQGDFNGETLYDALRQPDNRGIVLVLEDELTRFMQESEVGWKLVFPPTNGYIRLLLYKLADRFSMKPSRDGLYDEKRIVVERLDRSLVPILKLSDWLPALVAERAKQSFDSVAARLKPLGESSHRQPQTIPGNGDFRTVLNGIRPHYRWELVEDFDYDEDLFDVDSADVGVAHVVQLSASDSDYFARICAQILSACDCIGNLRIIDPNQQDSSNPALLTDEDYLLDDPFGWRLIVLPHAKFLDTFLDTARAVGHAIEEGGGVVMVAIPLYQSEQIVKDMCGFPDPLRQKRLASVDKNVARRLVSHALC